MTTAEVRQALVNQARAELGLTGAPASWTYEQQTAYIKLLASLVQANADQLPAADVSSAAYVQSKSYPALEDTSFDWAMFADEYASDLSTATKRAGYTLSAIAAVVAVVVALYFVITRDPRRYARR